MMRRRRVARAAVGTAVVAGTAGAVRHHQDKKYAQQDYEEQQMYADQAQQEQYAPPTEEYAAPEEDLTAKLQELAQLHESGVLTDEEFTAAKGKLLAS
jgi:hypothetical protein